MDKNEKFNEPKTVVNFEQIPVRRVWDQDKESWFFAVVDVVAALTDSPRPRKYWNALKTKLRDEGSELSHKLGQLKMVAKDGKNYATDVADTETLLRIIQTIPSPKAEPFKQWLARVGYERLQETVDPELAVNRARNHWKMVGRSEKWIEQRMRGVETRNKLTDYWQENGVKKGFEYASLTDIIHEEWSGLTTKEHKVIKSLKNENLRDNMTEAELIFTALAELSTTQIAKSDEAVGFKENVGAAHKGGKISGDARTALEQQTGKKIVSPQNFLSGKKKPNELED
jgi:hypothetical protein